MQLEISLPSIPNLFENFNEVPLVINQVKNKFGSLISNISVITNLDEYIIYGFIFVESKGNENAISGKSIGLMQINSDTANTAIIRENLNKGLTEAEQLILSNYLGDRLNPLLKSKFTWQLPANGVNKTDLLNPELNILIASMYINQLIFKTKEGNNIRMDKVIWLYNKGEYSKLPSGGIDKVYAASGNITGKYIRSLLGKNGVLDQLT
ncbi:MAG: transglycosylase SLT domain-containing protein [Bacteroidales bacterium]